MSHRDVKIDDMSGLTIDASHERRALLAGQHRGPGGVVSWTSDLANSALLSVGLQADARVSTSPAEAEWSVVVRRAEQTVVLIERRAMRTTTAPSTDSNCWQHEHGAT
jgi:hypothetical protein